ncbi:FGGY-family carbohydrate kinase [Spongiivirga citrea]|uniref:Carbohydrate kinase n=1 Tax=Spongiivirga citrea TaxID=1481457 RepID=A0A6M0CIU3_9FLAO|nr:FGGY family carbohydrate kinase [Spongiivirga citrea]NER17835.1 carbohydrate kinase [Spongiivirga citrea]
MQKKVTAVFDIGKTNKKFFLFDKDFREVYREYARFDEIKDEDGHPTEDLDSLKTWLKNVFDKIINTPEFDVKAINFSTYGASLVHIDQEGNTLTPLYNYTKTLPQDVVDSFYTKYGPELDFAVKTGSSNAGMLNSGMQLYWLKTTKPDIFKKIKYSLHLPQYISYIFTGIPVSEHTSIGCHTALWDYSKKDYHQWVYEEEIHKKLAPIVSSETSLNMNYNGKRIKIGVGIHDSSSALLPYIRSIRKKFVLVSTGTWSVSLNPFCDKMLSKDEVLSDCINYMRINGKPVKSSRLFLGNEYKLQVAFLVKKYKVAKNYHKQVKFDRSIFDRIEQSFSFLFSWESISAENSPNETKLSYKSFEEAYHHLMIELVKLQLKSIETAIGNDKIERLYIDGGFSDNELFIKLLSHQLRNMKLRTTTASTGSALGAAIAISDSKLNSKFLKTNYALKKHTPFIIN